MGFVVCQAKAQTRRRIHHCLRPPHRTCHFSSLGRSDSASPLSIDLSSHHRIGASQYLPSPGGHPQRSSLHPRRVAPVSVSLPPHLPGSRSPVSVYSGARKKDRMQTVREGENCSSNGLERAGPIGKRRRFYANGTSRFLPLSGRRHCRTFLASKENRSMARVNSKDKEVFERPSGRGSDGSGTW